MKNEILKNLTVEDIKEIIETADEIAASDPETPYIYLPALTLIQLEHNAS